MPTGPVGTSPTARESGRPRRRTVRGAVPLPYRIVHDSSATTARGAPTWGLLQGWLTLRLRDEVPLEGRRCAQGSHPRFQVSEARRRRSLVVLEWLILNDQ